MTYRQVQGLDILRGEGPKPPNHPPTRSFALGAHAKNTLGLPDSRFRSMLPERTVEDGTVEHAKHGTVETLDM